MSDPSAVPLQCFFSSYLNFHININSFLQVASLLEFWSCFCCRECLPNTHLGYCTSGKALVSLGALSFRFWVEGFWGLSALIGRSVIAFRLLALVSNFPSKVSF